MTHSARQPDTEQQHDAGTPPTSASDETVYSPRQPHAEKRRLPRHRFPQIEGYDIIRLVGRGGMGVVYEANQAKLNRRVALKFLPAVVSSAQPTMIKRFEQEAANLAKLHHTNIIPIYDFGESRDGYYYVMELLHGQPLSTVIKRLGGIDLASAPPTSIAAVLAEPQAPLDAHDPVDDTPSDGSGSAYRDATTGRDRLYYRRIATWAADIADALHYAHLHRMVHRDIKPSNIFVCTNGRIVLLDFGLVKVVGDETMTASGSLMGSCRYMSPEQIAPERGAVDERTDVYGLGATLYELLTFQPAFSATDQTELFGHIMLRDPTPPRKLIPSVPVDLDTICLKALEKAPTARYETAKSMADDLRLWLRDLPIVARPPGPFGRLLKTIKRHPAASLTTLAVLLLTVALIYATFAHRREQRMRRDHLLRDAVAHWQARRWDQSEAKFAELLDTDPDNYRALHNFAAARKDQYYYQQDERLLEQANQLLEHALIIEPTRTESWNLKGIIQRIRRDYPAAVREFQKSLELDPDYYPTWVNLGSVYALEGRLEEAENSLLRGAELVDTKASVMPFHNLAAVQLQLGKAQAAESIGAALRASRTNIPCQLLRARLHLQLAGFIDPPRALRYAIAADTNSGEDHQDGRIKRVLGIAELHNQHWERARQAAASALDYGDISCYPLLILAVAEARLDQHERAREHLQTALRDWPEQIQAAGYQAYVESGFLWLDSLAELENLHRQAQAMLQPPSDQRADE